MGRNTLDKLRINKKKLVKVTKRLVATNGEQITIDAGISLYLIHGNEKTTQMVYVATQASRMLLSHTACGELGLVTKDFLRIAAQTEATSCTNTKEDDDDRSPPHSPQTITMEPANLNTLETKEHLEDAINNIRAAINAVREIAQNATEYPHKETA